jgi:hypothetical protein
VIIQIHGRDAERREKQVIKIRGIKNTGLVLVPLCTMSKLKKAMFSLAAIMLLSTAVFSQDTLQIYVLAGQSNMEGQGMISADLTAMNRNGGMGTLDWYVQHDTNNTYSHIIDSTGKYIKLNNVWIDYTDVGGNGREHKGNLTTGYGVDTTKIGPEFQFGHVMGTFHNGPVLLIKTAWGGRSLAFHFRPPHSVPVKPGA